MKSKLLLSLFILIGLSDSAYLTYEHFMKILPPCSTNFFLFECGKVLRSSYSIFFGMPLALWGLFFYSLLLILVLFFKFDKRKETRYIFLLLTTLGFVVSVYLVYLQVFIIKNICLFCTISAVNSFFLFYFSQSFLKKERKEIIVAVVGYCYRFFIRPVLFIFDPEKVHESVLSIGEVLGKLSFIRWIARYAFEYKNQALSQKIAGVNFETPIGLAAGFDYEAKMPQILSTLGFGFETIGTITNKPYEGNPTPRLGRLPKSRSLMVNKGFKNKGAEEITKKLTGLFPEIPIGISIGRTNSKKPMTQEESVQDIVSAFTIFENSQVRHSYYELNISCPNLFGEVNFYSQKNLEELLYEIEKLKIKKPVFIKMPIEKSNKEVIDMLDVIVKYPIKGVIFGNVQKNRKDPSFDPDEVKQFKIGNFSGKPTEKRSNELIKLAYKKYGERLIIIGCGGIFSAKEAYKKIKLGSSLCQLITGTIYEGPQLVAQINLELMDLLEKDNLGHISEAIGLDNKI